MIEYSELTAVKMIAEGGFGVVYRAKHPLWETVVYKELKASIIKEGLKFVFYFYNSPYILHVHLLRVEVD